MEKPAASPNNQLNFRNHCAFCLKLQQPGILREICRMNSKNIQDFQPILNYLTGTDPTPAYDDGKEEKCLRKGLPLLPMCQQCYEMMGELNNLHQLLLHVQVSIQRQTEMIRETITETCPNPFLPSQRKEFNDRILSSTTMPIEQKSKVLKFISDLHDAIIYEGKKPVIYPSKPPLSMPSQQLIKATPIAPLPFTIPSAYSTATARHANATTTTTGADATQRIVVLKQNPRTPKHPTKVIITAAAATAPPPSAVPIQPSSSDNRKRKATLEPIGKAEPIVIQTTQQSNPPSPQAADSDNSDDEDDHNDIKYDPELETAIDGDKDSLQRSASSSSSNCEGESKIVPSPSPPEEEQEAEILYTPRTKVVIINTAPVTGPQSFPQQWQQNTQQNNKTSRVSSAEPYQKCDLCGQRCFLRDIVNHLKTHMKEQFITKCLNPNCGFHFSCPFKMEKHYRFLNGTTVCSKTVKKLPLSYWKMKCQACDFESGHRQSFRNHLKSHEDEIKQKKFSCPIQGCSKMYSLLQSVESHIYFHDLRPPPCVQNCPICKKVLKVDKIGSHLKEAHKIFEIFFCKHCNFQFPDRVTLLEHILEQKNEDGWTCDICEDGMKYTMRNELRKHYLHVHQIGERKSYICDRCSLEFATTFALRLHQHRKHPGKIELAGSSRKETEKRKPRYTCELCPSSSSSAGGTDFRNKGSLRAHNIKAHGADPFVCKHCDKTFTNRDVLRRHEREHAGIVTTFNCEVEDCKKIFNDRTSWHFHQLHAHKSVGDGDVERPFKCETCGKDFLRKPSLLFHQRSAHLGIRPYVCETCKEAFPSSTILKHHKLIHTGERPHKCPICDQAFRQKVVLRTHLKGHEKKGEKFKPNGPMKNIRKRVKKT